MASDQARRSRVRNGSRRRRDLAAVSPSLQGEADRLRADHAAAKAAQRDREERLRPQVSESPAASAAWLKVAAGLQRSVPESTYRIWFEPLWCIGEVKGALAVAGPDERRIDWVARTYGHMLGEAVRAETEYRGAFLFLAPPASTADDEGLL
jgi:hypothetical protein